ncbi:hypothetical protein K435DRAFT_970941 [Dendrothele bispora CBS 962.96]|uniref:Uncharacterized protein n=1 Tax=Dendrothele bispora (strain CBS 962.96) TaxID=1314807 RepID=A0A4V4HCX6_DENBC|nr:hypothetical protein K435DRAFT_970941 [Dendrothele bispora CBS 962.96]
MLHESDYWQPDSQSQPILLPPIPPSTSSASSSRRINWKLPVPEKVRPWITGATTDDIVDVEPEIVQAHQERWELKWKHLSEAPPNVMTSETISKMRTDEVKERSEWLNADLQRIIDRLTDLDIKQAQVELTTGRIFLTSLIEESIHSLLSINHLELNLAKDLLLKAEAVHQFALQSLTHILTTHNIQQIKKRSQRDDPQSTSLQSPNPPSSSSNENIAMPTPDHYPLNPISGIQNSTNSNPLPQAGIQQSTFHAGPLIEAQNPVPGVLQPQLPLQSTTQSSHKSSVTALLTIGFFGASIAWSTVFSGTRGNISLLAWAACTFIVATVCAAAASLLIASEEQIIQKHSHARWAVRILSRLASLHIFAGLILLSVAILVLDPNQGDISVDSKHGIGVMRAAGIYALTFSAMTLLVSFTIWRRYTHRQWYY